jgi:hypothetical protein
VTLAAYSTGAELMAAEGTGFGAALARAYLAADERDAATMRAAFGGYFQVWDSLLLQWEALRAGVSA